MERSKYGYLLRQLVILAGCLVLPALAMGQTAAGIAGTVRDTSGAVLPGVTVEASSPALIEKVRTAVTDSAGQYRILELRPGPYSVTFTLPGFTVIRRDGLELTTGSTATVNVDLPLGSLEETITVTGAAPIVDVQNTAATSVLTTAVLDSLPVARGLQGFGALTLGAVSLAQSPTRDVGGNSGDWAGRMFIHGVNEYGWYGTEGLTTMSILTDGSRRQEVNYAGLQEAVVNTGAPAAEFRSGGVSVNLIPKEGGNTFRGVLFGDYTGETLQSDNLDADLNARGVSTTNATKIVSDVYGGLGGPIVQDKLWFYTAHRWKKAEQELAGVFYNKLQGQSPLPHVSTTLFYEPDLTRPAFIPRPTRQYYHERLTWQAAAKHKITVTASDEDNCLCGSGVGAAGDPASGIWLRTAQRLIQPAWTYTATNRLLLEAGFNRRWEVTNTWFDMEKVGRNAIGGSFPGGNVQYTDRAMQDIGLGLRYGSHAGGSNPPLSGSGWHVDYAKSPSRTWAGRVAMSYVSGSHAFKTGVTHNGGWMDFGPGNPNFPEMYQLRNRVPSGLWQFAAPGYSRAAIRTELGVFAQDLWTTGRMTLNLGLRFDYFNGYSPAQVRPAGAYTPELRFDELSNIPNWKDLGPRVGVAYDLFGDGRTALKASFGRYVAAQATRIARDMSPADQIAGTVFRTWADTNGNYVPDCDLHNQLANGECGAMDNRRFGTAVPSRLYAADYLNGWGKRLYNWQGSVSVQHELTSGLAVNAGYFRTVNANFEITDNLAITPADFDPYCITAPVDPRLPAGGGNQICDLYDVKPEKFGQVDRLVLNSSHNREFYNGVDLGMNARFGQGGTFFGGVSLAELTLDTCAVVDSPDLRFCKTTDAQHHVKFAGSYPLPWGLQASANFQNLPGVNQLANLRVGNALIVSSLGRNLGACRGAATCNATVNVPLVEPGTVREPRQSQLDVRLGKLVQVGRFRFEPKVELFNALNANDPQDVNPLYNASWPRVSSVLAGRMVKFGAQLNF